MLKIRRSRDRLIFNMGIPILVRRHLYIETALRLPRVFMVVAWHAEVLNPHHHLKSWNGRGLFLSNQVTAWLGYRYSSWKAPQHMKRHKWRSYFGQPDFSLYEYIMIWPLLITKKPFKSSPSILVHFWQAVAWLWFPCVMYFAYMTLCIRFRETENLRNTTRVGLFNFRLY